MRLLPRDPHRPGFHWIRRRPTENPIVAWWNAELHALGARGWGPMARPDQEHRWEYLGPCPEPAMLAFADRRIAHLERELAARGDPRAAPPWTRALEAAIRCCEDVEVGFLAVEYAGPDPLSSFNERFACRRCRDAIRALRPTGEKG